MLHRPAKPAVASSAFHMSQILFFAVLVLLPNLAHANRERWQREGWKTDFSQTTITFDEILSGGLPRDGIPSIDTPVFKKVSEIADLADNEPVVSLMIGEDARAYPLRILIWHEIANDKIGDVPVAITYCPLCNSAIAFDRRVGDRILEFGTTGKLRNSDLVMYDRASESWWQQFTGEAIVGEMVGQTLKALPARLESYAQFKEREPAGRVLIPNDPAFRQYGQNPYIGYDRSNKPFLYNGSMPDGINPMARVVVVRSTTPPTAIALALLREKKSISAGAMTLTWQPGQASAIDTAEISKGRDVGSVSAVMTDSAGSKTNLPYDVTFAFVVHAFHPNITIRSQ